MNFSLNRSVHFLLTACLFILLDGKLSAADDKKQDSIAERFAAPAGFTRIPVEAGSFAHWLRNLKLQPEHTAVRDFRGNIFKTTDDTTVAAVTTINVEGRNLEQCMDILLRLQVEYLTAKGLKEDIVFPLPDGTLLSWPDWKTGKRPHFKGLHFSLPKQAVFDSSAGNFRKYLNAIYQYSGSQTFYHYYRDIPADSVRIGDFIVRKQRRGHAVIVVDLAKDKNGNRYALIAQGDTPACPLYILNYRKDDPWFPVNTKEEFLPLPIRKKMSWDGLRRFP